MPVKGASNYAAVTVDEVNLATRTANVTSNHGGSFQVSFRNSPAGILLIPEQGDKWVIKRIGSIWYFDSRLDTVDDQAWLEENMQPGDIRLVGNNITLQGQTVSINDHLIGATTYYATTASGSTSSFSLPDVPVGIRSLQAFSNGLLIDPRTLSLTDNVISFASAPSAGTLIIYYQADYGS